jgi:hypothetical protein
MEGKQRNVEGRILGGKCGALVVVDKREKSVILPKSTGQQIPHPPLCGGSE